MTKLQQKTQSTTISTATQAVNTISNETTQCIHFNKRALKFVFIAERCTLKSLLSCTVLTFVKRYTKAPPEDAILHAIHDSLVLLAITIAITIATQL